MEATEEFDGTPRRSSRSTTKSHKSEKKKNVPHTQLYARVQRMGVTQVRPGNAISRDIVERRRVEQRSYYTLRCRNRRATSGIQACSCDIALDDIVNCDVCKRNIYTHGPKKERSNGERVRVRAHD